MRITLAELPSESGSNRSCRLLDSDGAGNRVYSEDTHYPYEKYSIWPIGNGQILIFSRSNSLKFGRPGRTNTSDAVNRKEKWKIEMKSFDKDWKTWHVKMSARHLLNATWMRQTWTLWLRITHAVCFSKDRDINRQLKWSRINPHACVTRLRMWCQWHHQIKEGIMIVPTSARLQLDDFIRRINQQVPWWVRAPLGAPENYAGIIHMLRYSIKDCPRTIPPLDDGHF